MRKRIISITLLFISIIFVGCIKPKLNEPIQVEPENGKIITSIEVNSDDPNELIGIPEQIAKVGWTISFDYDSQNRLISIKNFRTDRLRNFNISYGYNDITVKSSAVSEPDNIIEYRADIRNNLVDKIYVVNAITNSSKLLFDTFIYNDKLELQGNTYNEHQSARVIDEYKWSNNNIVSVKEGAYYNETKYLEGISNINNIDLSPIVSNYFNRVELKPFLLIGALGTRSAKIMQDSDLSSNNVTSISYDYEYNSQGSIVVIKKTRQYKDKIYTTTYRIHYI